MLKAIFDGSDQVKNVAGDPAYAGARKEMGDRLMRILIEAGDPRVVGDGETFERPPFTDKRSLTRSPAAA